MVESDDLFGEESYASISKSTSSDRDHQRPQASQEVVDLIEVVGSVEVEEREGEDGAARGRPERPKLPGSIKKLNRLLSRQRAMEIPEADLDEKFVKGRGPGGQAINKTNSSVSLTHIPTGIRVQAQPTRSREENRKVARRILAEKLDILRATGQLPLSMARGERESAVEGVEVDFSELKGREKRVAEEKALSRVWTKAEIRAEKERRRKASRAKKAKKKYAKVGEAGTAASPWEEEAQEPQAVERNGV